MYLSDINAHLSAFNFALVAYELLSDELATFGQIVSSKCRLVGDTALGECRRWRLAVSQSRIARVSMRICYAHAPVEFSLNLRKLILTNFIIG